MRVRLLNLLMVPLLAMAADASAQSSFPNSLPVGCATNQVPVYDASTLRWNCGTPAGGGDVTASTALTANAVVLGAGTSAVKAVAGVVTDGVSALQLGVAGTSVGSLILANATSGTVTFAPATGALGTIAITVPAVTGTLATRTGAFSTDDCAKFNAAGQMVSAGAACGSGGGGAPTDATYITQTANGSLSAEQALGGLASGCLSSTTTTGVIAARTLTGTALEISVANGDCTGTPTFSLPAVIDLGGKTSFEIPNAAAPTTDAFGEIAGDNNAWGSGRGALALFDGTATVWMVGILASDTCANGDTPIFNTGGTWTCEPSLTFADPGANAFITWNDGGSALATLAFSGSATGSGDVVLANSPTLITPILGVPSAGTLNLFSANLFNASVCQNTTASIGLSLPTSNAPTATCITGSNTQFGTALFTATGQSAQGMISILEATATTVVTIKGQYFGDTTSAGNVTWRFSYARVAAGGTLDPSWTNVDITDAAGTADQLNIFSGTATISSLAAGDLLFWKITYQTAPTTPGDQNLINLAVMPLLAKPIGGD